MIKATVDLFRNGLHKTRASLADRLQQLFAGKRALDGETLERIEELLIGADMGVKSSVAIVQNIERRLRQEGEEASLDAVMQVIRRDVKRILTEARPRMAVPAWTGDEAKGAKRKKKKRKAQPVPAADPVAEGGKGTGGDGQPRVIFVVGVNGSGKTTSIAKLAHMLQEQGQKVLLAAGDTFRAAAVEQLQVWADRVGADCVQQGTGADPAAVVHDALAAAAARGHDVVIVDTAGRLHTKTNLMDELGKVARVIMKQSGRPPETLLVVDANTGQNGLAQARVFAETIPVDGLILAKLDGTAKGGIVVAIAETLGLPVKYVGLGEQAGDLAEFDPELFVEALFADWQQAATEDAAAASAAAPAPPTLTPVPEPTPLPHAEPEPIPAAHPATAAGAESGAETAAAETAAAALLAWTKTLRGSLFS